MDKKQALQYHAMGRPGKIEVVPTKPHSTQYDLSLAYSPGVAEPCLEIQKKVTEAYKYTAKSNLVAVISNGTAVLGLGDIGAVAGKPVMEGKGLLFKIFADIDVFDIEVDTKDVDKFIETVKMIAPTFGGINLEDIKAPECFEIERRLKEDLDIVSAGYYLLGKRTRRGYSRINRSGDGKDFLRRLYKDPLLKTRTFVWGKLFKASLLKENRIQFPTDLLSFEDLPFYYQCLLAAKRVRYVKTPLYYYRQSSASLTKRTRGVLESHLLAFEKGRDIIQKTDPALFQELFGKTRLAITLQLRYDSHLDIRKGKERAEAKRECRKAVESLFGKEK